MITNIPDDDKKRIIGLFEAKFAAEEDHKLTMQGYNESLKEVGEKIGAKTSDINKAFGEWKLLQKNPEVRENRDAIMTLVFNS